MIVFPDGPAPQTLADLTAAVEKLGPRGPDGDGFLAVTTEPFVTLTSGGIKRDGEAYPAWFRPEPLAIEAFWDELRMYLNGAAAVYWRALPEVRARDLTNPQHVVTARLAVSMTLLPGIEYRNAPAAGGSEEYHPDFDQTRSYAPLPL